MSNAKYAEYDDLREAFFHSLTLRLAQKTGLQVEVSHIQWAALAQTLDWKHRLYQWSWFELKRKFRNVPARFELAISVRGELCGLAIGKPSWGRRHLSVYFLEGKPDDLHPLKSVVLPLVLESANLYAAALGCSFLRLVEPVMGLQSRYERWGFKLGKDAIGRLYCEQRLS